MGNCIKDAVEKVLGATTQRCRVHFMRNVLARVPKAQKSMVSAMVKTVVTQEKPEDAHQQWREVADRLRPQFDKAAELMDAAEHDVFAFMQFLQSLMASWVRYEVVEMTTEHAVCRDQDGETRLVACDKLKNMFDRERLAREPAPEIPVSLLPDVRDN